MSSRVSLSRFERDLQGMAGNISLFRRGINEVYLSQYGYIYEQLKAVRRELEGIGMYERCRDALRQVEAWVREGPQHDSEAEALLLNVGGDLARASGSYDALQRRFGASNDEEI